MDVLLVVVMKCMVLLWNAVWDQRNHDFASLGSGASIHFVPSGILRVKVLLPILGVP